ncbi:MAG: HypC/HybG/HupF family hydrogenase formation chaperone [Chloroflexota bacterium]
MCIERPGRVIEIGVGRPDLARVDVGGEVKTVHLGMLGEGEPPAVGDWLALHLGFAIERMTEEQAREALTYAENDPFEAFLGELDDGPAGGPRPEAHLEASS